MSVRYSGHSVCRQSAVGFQCIVLTVLQLPQVISLRLRADSITQFITLKHEHFSRPIYQKFRLAIISILLLSMTTCSSWTNTGLFAYTNRQKFTDRTLNAKASFLVIPDRGDPEMLMILAFSGGGSRAAYWSASVMLRLEQVFPDLNLLEQVDAISAVSGGALPAAYYALSTDPGVESKHGRIWREDIVKQLMSQNYIARWIGNWFWPSNIAKYWFTAFDRTDIMAQTLADNLYDIDVSGEDLMKGRDLLMGEMNTERPYVILNSTNATAENNQFGQLFTFTKQDFDKIDSEINDYSIARAVMASASFPGAFNSMTLLDYTKSEEAPHYIHIFDGGNVDNLRLMSVQRILHTLHVNQIDYKKIVVILVDAYTAAGGVQATQADSRSTLDFIVDSNIIDATDSLLSANRKNKISRFIEAFKLVRKPSRSLFYHLKFSDIKDGPLSKKLNRIKTSFSIEAKDRVAIDNAIDRLLTPQNTCLVQIKQLLEHYEHQGDSLCSYSN